MADVTFGVKVPEEMKNELSLMMKEHTLSGKEFMSMLLASYKLDQAKDEGKMYESDIMELQNLVKRIQGIFFNMVEKSKMNQKEEQEALEKVIEAQKAEKEELLLKKDELEKALAEAKVKEAEHYKKEEALVKEVEAAQRETKLQKVQLENNLLLHKKFEEEVTTLKARIASLERLELEIEERNDENTKLKTRNDELASEVWFLQRDAEKNTKEKEQLLATQQKEATHLKEQFALQLKNELLEQKLRFSEEISKLKDEISSIKDEKMILEREFQAKLDKNTTKLEKNTEKK